MKNDDQMFQSVLSRRNEYQERRKRRILTIKHSAPFWACFCLCAVLGLGYWNHFRNIPSIPVQHDVIDETTLEVPETTTSTESENTSKTQSTKQTDHISTTASIQTQTTAAVTDATETPTTEQSVNQTETQAPATIPPVTYTQPITDPPVQQTDSVKYEEFSLDYPYYNTVSDLAGKANQVFSGRVTNISFELLNMITMQPLKDGEDTQWAMICTIYEIEAEKVYAGSPTIVKLRIEGGISSGFEQEQTTLLGSDKIPVMEGAPVLYVGDKYLFALYHADDSEYSSILNPQQSIYAENGSKTGEFSADEIISYYS